MRLFFLDNIKDVELNINKNALNYYKNGSNREVLIKEFHLLLRIMKHYVDKKLLIRDLWKYKKPSQKIFIFRNLKQVNEWINHTH